MNTEEPAWLADAARLPIAFAQVREDPLIDLHVVERLPTGANVLMIASGGCTAALLAASPNIGRIRLVDPNPAQLALSRLKLHLLSESPVERRRIVGHAEMPASERRDQLTALLSEIGLRPDSLGSLDFVAEVGPDHAGRYEQLFAALQLELSDVRDDLRQLLHLSDPKEQSARVSSATLIGRRIDEAFDLVLALPNLVRLFGEGATQNPVEPFFRHFARRLRHCLATLPARDNPWLWQMLLGHDPPNAAAPWLDVGPPPRLPTIEYTQSFMIDALRDAPAGSFDFVHLSNILDWLSEAEAAETLHLAHKSLKPGGWVLIRQLNSTLDVRRIGSMFDWLAEADDLHAVDRSFFYRALHLGRPR